MIVFYKDLVGVTSFIFAFSMIFFYKIRRIFSIFR